MLKWISVLALVLPTFLLTDTTYASPSTSYAQSWATVGGGCIVEDRSLSTYTALWGDLQFATGQTGTIKAICPITSFSEPNVEAIGQAGPPDRMGIVFYDADGTADDCYVTATLRYNPNDQTGGSGTIATYSSATDTSVTAGRNAKNATISTTWSFDANFYWIEVTMFRDVTTCNPTLEGLSIYRYIP